MKQHMLHEKIEEVLLEKIKQRHEEFGKLRYWSPQTIRDIRMRETTAFEKMEDALKAGGWRDIRVGEEWGGNGEFAWFRLKFTVPKEYAGKKLVTILKMGLTGWLGGEGCLFINGVPYQGVDRYHPEVVLDEKARPGKEYDLVVECVSTEVWQNKLGKVRFEQADIAAINQEVWDYWYDLGFLLGIAGELPADDRRRVTIVYTLNKSVDAFDPEAGSFEALSETARKARKVLSPLYKNPANASALELGCIGHSHIDVAWYWPYAETIRKCSRTFSTVDRLMEEYPHYIFTQSQAQVYEFTKEHYPDLYARIKKRVKEGRFEPQGSAWVEADCNLCSGESLVRQILLGKGFFMDEFDIETDVFWLPDVFGYSAAIPQILKKAGVDYFMTIKISWNQFNRFPYSTFYWKGIDGTPVLAHFAPVDTYNALNNPEQLRMSEGNYREKDRSDIALHIYGWGDGGGGPDRTHLEFLPRAQNLEGAPKCTPMSVGEFFRQLEKRSQDLPIWVGELYFELHRGTYTTQARNKRYNRKSEFLLRDAEAAAGLAWMLSGAEYPHADLTHAWKLVCKNQFHDVIPGSSVTAVYEDSTRDYQEVAKLVESARDGALAALWGSDPGGEVVRVFNSLSWDRADAVKAPVPGSAKEWRVETEAGQALPSQVSEDGSALWVDAGEIPGIGVGTLRLVKGALKRQPSEIKVSRSGLENRFFQVKLDRQGLISSIYDKRADREVLPEGARANVLQIFEDKPLNSDAWDIDFYYEDKCRDLTELSKISVVESGPVRGSVEIRRKFGKSELVQKVVLWSSTPRIDFETWVDWHEDRKMLKVAFPVDIHSENARFEIQYGSVDRPNHRNTSWDFARFEVAAHKWVDLSQPDYGVSLMNDCKYGHDVRDNVLRLTLLRSPKEPDPTADMGEHVFTYSLFPHLGDWREGETVHRAYELNVPTIAWLSGKGQAAAERLLSVDAPNVIVEAVKKAEKEDALVVRMYECEGAGTECRLQPGFNAGRVTECDLLERDIQTLKLENGGLSLEFKPFEIRTVKLYPGLFTNAGHS